MKIPLIWLKDYVETTKSAGEIAASFTQLGLMLDKPLDEKNVLDLEHRMDRSDWLSLIGCARDLAAFEGLPLILSKGHTKPGLKPKTEDKIALKVTTPAVHRFATRIFKGIKVGPSPKWLVERLESYGIDTKNNIVDITNFVMVEYAQPMHAQDIAKLKGQDITIRPAKSGEKLTTILGTEIKLDPDVFVLTSGGEATVIGGIVGGKDTSVTDGTTDIILDSGNYDSRVIRKTSRRLKIINETVSRYDKFLDPRTIDFALSRATSLILELAGGTYYLNDDYYPSPVVPKTQTLRLSRLQQLSGMNLSLASAKKTLKSLDYVVIEESDTELTLEIPYFRTDVEVEDDLISDILRIHNYTNIPQIAMSSPVPRDITPSIYSFEDRLRDLLVAQGAHEHITSSLVSQSDKPGEVILANALSSDQNALRHDLLDGLTQVLRTYQKHKQNNIPVFEIGKVFRIMSDKYLEGRHLTVMFPEPSRLSDSLATLFSSLGITKYYINKSHEIFVGDSLVGTIDSNSYTLVTDSLMPPTIKYAGIVSEFSHATSLDISLLLPTKVLYADIITTLSKLKANWQSIACKSVTKMEGDINNYLLTITWPTESKSVVPDKILILKTLKDKLGITSKS